jgi:hydroxyacylglutathione hydrolase
VAESTFRYASIVSVPFEENTYVVHLEGRKDCLIVDPGFEPDKIFAYIEKHGLEPVAILNTHGHSDHIAGNEAMKQRWPAAPLVIGINETEKLSDPYQNLSGQFGLPMTSPAADTLLEEGETYSAAGMDFEIFEIPGHSSGHIVFVWRGGQPHVVLGGDVLFRGSIGRTDFPDGSFEKLRQGIHEKLFTLADDTLVLSGHGPETTIGDEKATNAFVGRPAGYDV